MMENLTLSELNMYREYKLEVEWTNNPRWKDTRREHTAQDVIALRGSLDIEYTFAKHGAELLWCELVFSNSPVRALGALTANQAIQQARAKLKAIYVSGWQVAADRNGSVYPDQSLYPADCVPKLVKEINAGLLRADQIESLENKRKTDWFVPIVADCEAGFGGNLNAYEITRAMIEAGAAAVHFEDQLSSEKKCGHLGGKVLVPTQEMINKLKASRLAADVCGVPLVIIARTDADSSKLLTNNYDARDLPFGQIDWEYIDHRFKRTTDGYYKINGGIKMAIARGLAYAPYADMIWMETSKPDLKEAEEFAKGIHEKFPGKILAYNCSPSFNWTKAEGQLEYFQDRLYEFGYKFQFVTLAGFHTLNHSMFKLAKEYEKYGMLAYKNFQASEFESEKDGFEAVRHQKFVGTGYFDKIQQIISGGQTSTIAMKDSTEVEQFSATH
jgi:isocitrate lyase